MRKLIVSEFVTLDGVMQAPGGKDEDRDSGFERGACDVRLEGGDLISERRRGPPLRASA